MMYHFKIIGIIGYPCHLYHPRVLTTCKILYHWLNKKGITVIIENQIANDLSFKKFDQGSITEIGQHADLAIVVGGDGNMLSVARTLAQFDIKVIGINRGNLGFLTDIDSDKILAQLSNVLIGYYYIEKRFLLELNISYSNTDTKSYTAINEVVLHSGKIAHMIEFEVYIDNNFAFSQRSDGLIIATPTGSTAYSLSAGGPIIIPTLNVIVLVPMFPHTLSSRPLVISNNSIIHLKFSKLTNNLEISCDSQIITPIHNDQVIFIKRSNFYLNLIHPKEYNYFNTLSNKLSWSRKHFN